MRNTGILLFLAGLYIIFNSGSFRDVVLGKAHLNFSDPKATSTPTTSNTGGGGGARKK